MGTGIWIGDSGGTARKVKNLWVGDSSGTARKIKKIWVGDSSGIARLCYTATIDASVTLSGAVNDTIQYTYNGTTTTVTMSSGAYSKTITIPLLTSSVSITFKSTKTNQSKTQTIYGNQTNTVNLYPDRTIYWYGRWINKSNVAVHTTDFGVSNQTLTESTDHLIYAYKLGGSTTYGNTVRHGLKITLSSSISTSYNKVVSNIFDSCSRANTTDAYVFIEESFTSTIVSKTKNIYYIYLTS